MSRRARITGALALLLTCLGLLQVGAADARSLYVADGLSSGPGLIDQFRLDTSGRPLALDPPTVETGDSPQHLALTPDGRFAYGTSAGTGALFAYRVGSDGTLTALDPPSAPAGIGAHGVVVSPDGNSAYVGNQEAGSVTQYDIAADGTLTPKDPPAIVSGSGESGGAMAPDGRSVYVTDLTDNSVGQFSVDRATGNLSPKPRAKVVVPAAPSGLAVNPDGKTLYVATLTGNVFQFTILANGGLRRMKPAKVKAGLGASGVAIDARGTRLYTPNSATDSVSQFAIGRSGRLSPLRPAAVPVGDRPEGVAISPDGRSLFVAIAGENSVRWLTIGADGRLRGAGRSPIPAGPGPHGLVVSPDQSPVASLETPRNAVAGRKVILDAAGSYDVDGRVARYLWRFGDGSRATTKRPRVAHRFRRPGSFAVRLTVIDDEGCSGMAYTGQSALCTGSQSKTWVRVRVRRPGTRPQARRSGALTQLRGPAGCVVDDSTAARGCSRARALQTPGPFLGSRGIAISPDGRHAYVASSGSDAIAIFSRNLRTGQLSQAAGSAGCVSEGGVSGCASAIGLEGPASVTVSPDGSTVYAASVDSDSVTAFSRDRRSGALTQLAGGCVSEQTIAGCATGRALDGADTVVVSPDGGNVYAGAFHGNAIATFDRDSQGAITQPGGTAGCLSATSADGCGGAVGINAVESLTIASDGGQVYAAGALSGAVTAFDRDGSGTLTQATGGCLSMPAATGCSLGRGILGVNAVDTSPNGRQLYAVSAIGSALTGFKTDGGLTQLPGRSGCLAPVQGHLCAVGNGIDVPEALTVSPDGRNLYLASFESWAVVSLRRDRNGRFRQLAGRRGCLAPASDGCGAGRHLAGAAGIAISPDGRFVYATSSVANAVTVFHRDG
ncbi:MAG: beta-propeller fold lactonase family protein [Solirubrobacterales bacterium]|nr:beta-propeller fold lactonase family protein [Solirubrobacterales bacterium]